MNPFWLSIGAVVGYALLMAANPVGASLRDGLRALRRYDGLWFWFGLIGFTDALFQLLLRWRLAQLLPDAQPLAIWSRAPFRPESSWLSGASDSLWYLPPGAMKEAARNAYLPALDGVAGLFNNYISTFPFAFLAALLFLLNWRGRQVFLFRALQRRFGNVGWLIQAFIIVCALASLVKPALYLLPRAFDPTPFYQWAPVAAWLAFLFEYLFGLCLQIYLLLLAYCWVRGLNFSPSQLFDLAIRRCAPLIRWAALVMLLSTLLIDVPLILKGFPFFGAWLPKDAASLDRWIAIARTILDCTLLFFATLQLTLVFHGASLRRAFIHHFRFIARYGWPLSWFIVISLLHLYLLQFLRLIVAAAIGEGTALWLAWLLLFPWLAAFPSGWLLSAWLSFFKRADIGRLHDAGWIKF